jgi:acyl dehydratase
MRELVGTPLVVEQWNDQASHDAIKHFAWGIGDDNPLWLNASYAAESSYGAQVAPPTFVYSVHEGAVVRGISNELQPLHAGSRLLIARPIRVGEWVSASSELVSVDAVEGRTAGRMARQVGRTTYSVEGDEVARVEQTLMCIRRPSEVSAGAYETRAAHEYSADELAQIQAGALAEQRRGAEPRYWEDVAEGDELSEVVKGPLDLTTMTAYYAGAIANPTMRGVETRARLHHRVRTAAADAPTNYDPEYLLGEMAGGRGHQDPEAARRSGLPGAYDVGNQRASWVGHCVTNWMGDAAELLELNVQIRRPNVFGDTQWIGGTVSAKDLAQDGSGLVQLNLRGRNQLGDTTTTADAEVRCPRRDARN